MNWTRDRYEISDDKSRLNLETIVAWLQSSYWAIGRPPAVIRKSIEHSVCLGLYAGPRQIGFCRAVTDHATFTWICDVIIDPEYRGRGLGKWMVEVLITHPALQTRTQLLATQDAHALYERFGFKPPDRDYLKRALEAVS